MAISNNHLTDGQATPFGAHSATTSSFTPTANRLVLVKFSIISSFGWSFTDPTVSTTTGLNFVKVVSTPKLSGAFQQWVYRGMKPSGLSSGTVTVDLGSDYFDTMFIVVDEFGGVDTSGTDGSGAIVQSANDGQEGGADTASATLGSFSSANNGTYLTGATYDASALLTNTTYTGGFTSTSFTAAASSRRGEVTAWRSDNSTTCQVTIVTTGNRRVLACSAELKAASAGGVKVPPIIFPPTAAGQGVA